MGFCPLWDLGAQRNYLSSNLFVKVRLSGGGEKKANVVVNALGKGG